LKLSKPQEMRLLSKRWLGLSVILLFVPLTVFCADTVSVEIVYLSQKQALKPALSNLDSIPKDEGLQGALLAIQDNNTTGKFTGHQFKLLEKQWPEQGVNTQDNSILLEEKALVVAALGDNALLEMKQLAMEKSTLIMDVVSRADHFRQQGCADHVFYLAPSRAMRADALAQYLLKKRWVKWFLVQGPTNEDKLFSQALKRAAKRFGSTLVAQKTWLHDYDARRTAQAEVSVFTQGVDYDVLVVADEQGLFGEYLSYRTWKPRPVVGTQGLVPTAWHKTHEQWGAVQIQNRFKAQAGRRMTEKDYAAYLAIRSYGEAIIRVGSSEPEKIKAYLLSDQFTLQGYKGRPLSFRSWNGQLRQPVLLAAPRAMVATAPIQGFLHPITELDTLGYDQREVDCNE
jgi:ABC transporter substrate binding protein (PQQ-dependent alcohol dehydrogenase system)